MRLVSEKKHLVQSIEDSSIPCLWLCTTTNDAKASSIYWVCSGQKKIEQVRNIVRLYVILIESSVSVASPRGENKANGGTANVLGVTAIGNEHHT